jgi:hypothetical protein
VLLLNPDMDGAKVANCICFEAAVDYRKPPKSVPQWTRPAMLVTENAETDLGERSLYDWFVETRTLGPRLSEMPALALPNEHRLLDFSERDLNVLAGALAW